MLKKIAKYFSVLIFVLLVLRLGYVYYDGLYSGVRKPYLQMLGTDQATIKWQTLTGSKASVKYGKDNSEFVVSETKKTTQHQVTLKNLVSNSKYWYQIDNHKYYFFTAPAKTLDRDLNFWVLGDPGKPSQDLLKVKQSGLDFLTNKRLDLILTTGDNAYESGTGQDFQDSIFNVFGSLLSSTNIWPAYGNHDARRFAFFDIFKFPKYAELGGVASDTEDYFSFNYGNVHLVFLNSEYHPFTPKQLMRQWLIKDLSNNQQKWTIVVFHSPPYTKGSHNSDSWRDSLGRMVTMRENIVPIFDKFGVDLVLAGHSHSFERSHLISCHYENSDSFASKMVLDDDGVYQKNLNKTAYDGTVYLVLGSSSKVDNATFNHPAMPIYFAKLGSLMLQINDVQLKSSFIDNDGKILDSFIIDKTINIERAKNCEFNHS